MIIVILLVFAIIIGMTIENAVAVTLIRVVMTMSEKDQQGWWTKSSS